MSIKNYNKEIMKTDYFIYLKLVINPYQVISYLLIVYTLFAQFNKLYN